FRCLISRESPSTSATWVRSDEPGAQMRREQKIGRLAYEIWETEGRLEGRHLDHWLVAERTIDGSVSDSADSASVGSSYCRRTSETGRKSAGTISFGIEREIGLFFKRTWVQLRELGKGIGRPPRRREFHNEWRVSTTE